MTADDIGPILDIARLGHGTRVTFAGRPDLTREFSDLSRKDDPCGPALYVLQTIVREWPHDYAVLFPGVVGKAVRAISEAHPDGTRDTIEGLVFMGEY